jgi:hypothetical protein
MGNALIVLIVPEENLTLTGLRERNPDTGALESLPKDERFRCGSYKAAVQAHPRAFWTMDVRASDVWFLPKEHGGRWHFDPKLLAAHVEKVRGSLESFLNEKLKQLDDMVRSGWFVIERVRAKVIELRERPHGPTEK